MENAVLSLARVVAAASVRRASLACVTAAIVTALAAGCAGERAVPTAPAAGSDRSLGGLSTLTQVRGLLRTTPLLASVVVTKTLTRDGGVIRIPEADFELVVPAGAFDDSTMTFTITAYSGRVIAYDFQPHGTRFNTPLQAVQGLNSTGWVGMDKATSYYTDWAGAYFADFSQIDGLTGDASINEFTPCRIDVATGAMTFDVPHFSGYMISTGRSSEGDDSNDKKSPGYLN